MTTFDRPQRKWVHPPIPAHLFLQPTDNPGIFEPFMARPLVDAQSKELVFSLPDLILDMFDLLLECIPSGDLGP
jgi:hypothetical protein